MRGRQELAARVLSASCKRGSSLCCYDAHDMLLCTRLLLCRLHVVMTALAPLQVLPSWPK